MNDGIIDTNLHLSRWPCRRLPLDEPRRLAAKLRSAGVRQAWASSFDGLLHNDISAVNQRLLEMCRTVGDSFFRPFGVVNPTLDDWQHDLVRCATEWRMPGIRVYPSYHGVELTSPLFRQMLELAAQHRLLVQLVVKLEDERTQHARMRAETVNVLPLVPILRELPQLKLQLLNALRDTRREDLEAVLACGNAYVEIAMLEGVGGLERLLETVSIEHVLFGSHCPLFYFESAVLKLDESQLGGLQRSAICQGNAVQLMHSTRSTPTTDK